MLPSLKSAGVTTAVAAHLAMLAALVVGTSKPAPAPAAANAQPPAATVVVAPPAIPAYTGEIYPRLILPKNPTPTQYLLGTNPQVVQACATYASGLRVYTEDDPVATGAGWDQMAKQRGGPPAMLYIEPGNILRASGWPDPASVVNDLRTIRTAH